MTREVQRLHPVSAQPDGGADRISRWRGLGADSEVGPDARRGRIDMHLGPKPYFRVAASGRRLASISLIQA